MFRIRLSKFKQVIAVAIIPRFFVRDTKQIRNKLNNYHDVFNFARKSTDSGSKDDEIEKQRQIIEKCFGETPQPSESESESKDLKDHSSEMEKERRNIEFSDFVRLSGAEKYDISNAPHNKPSQGLQAEEATVQATTANIAEETLDQRVETIDETPHVEASPQKNEGFNTTPKVLGHDIEFFADEKIQKIDLDDLAKRCVGAPIGNIDEMLIKEMKNMTNNDTKTETDVNLIKCHGVEKYYSGIFEIFAQTKTQKVDDTEKEPLCLFEENRSVGDKEIKSERITPLHVDAVHLFAFDEGLKDYKETGFFRGNSLNLSSEIEEPLLDVPNTISPYESRAMPFYEYDNKEQVDNLDESKTMYITETATDTRSKDIPRAEEVFFRKEDTDEPRLVIEKQEMDPVKSESNLSPTARPILVESKLKGHDNPSVFGNLSREQLLKLLYFYKSSTINETDKSHVFSTSTEIPSAAGINPSPNSSISGTNVPEIATKEANENMDMPVNSAISANQNPGEYYNMVLYEQQDSNLSQQQHSLTAENHIMQAFCTQLQEMQDGVPKETEDSIRVLEYPVLLRHPFSYILLEQDTIKNKVKEAPNNKVMATTIENVTDSMKNDATNADEVPLSQILKQIRDKNRLEFCQNLFLQNAKPERSKTFTCMAPLDSNKQKSSPRPCQPPPKPPKEKCPKPCPPPCPPKKDPCAKLIPFFLNTIINFDDLFDIQVPTIPLNSNYCYKTMLTDDVIARLRKLGESLRFVKLDTNYINDTTCAKDFEPWIPIPSWPAPKVEKKKPFVCPKEGCKPVPIPRSNLPKQRPCVGVPKKFFSEHKPVNTPDIIFINL